MQRNRIPQTLLTGMQNGTATLGEFQFLLTFNEQLPQDPAIAFLDINYREVKLMFT